MTLVHKKPGAEFCNRAVLTAMCNVYAHSMVLLGVAVDLLMQLLAPHFAVRPRNHAEECVCVWFVQILSAIVEKLDECIE